MKPSDCHYYDEDIVYSEIGLPFRIKKICRCHPTTQDTVLCDPEKCYQAVTPEQWRDRISKAIEESRRLIL